MEELAQRLQQLETQVGQQRAVIEHQQDQLMRQQTTIDVDRAARTQVTPIAQDARGNLVDLRVGNKPETFAGETHDWKGWPFKMRQYISAIDDEPYVELVDLEANPLRELPLFGMNELQKKRERQFAFMLTMHTKDRALQMITKLSDPGCSMYDTEVGKVTADCRVLDVRRPMWSLGAMMDSGCDVHFTKDRCWNPKMAGKSSTLSAVAECSSWQPDLQDRRRGKQAPWNSIR